MATLDEKIKKIEDELKITPSNKATQGHRGLLKAKIAKLRGDVITRSSQKKDGHGYSVKKSGDATVVLLGYPSVGKSTLINMLTNVESPVAMYEFTTLDAIPGIMKYEDASIQVVDIPGIIEGASRTTKSRLNLNSRCNKAKWTVVKLVKTICKHKTRKTSSTFES